MGAAVSITRLDLTASELRNAASGEKDSKRSPDERSDIRGLAMVPACRCAHAGYLAG
jgi:hypothetical protein